MLLVDSMYINNSGGKILLDFLVQKLEESGIDTFYLFDDRCKTDYQNISEERKTYLKASLLKRYHFYKQNKYKFSKVFCFGNLPPLFKLNVPVYTYFHQLLFIEIPKSVSPIDKMKIQLKMGAMNFLKKNTDFWIVQSENVKIGLGKRYNLSLSSISVLPFYSSLSNIDPICRAKHSFVYVSNGGPHKNHANLINAFCLFYDKYKIGELRVTISDDIVELKEKIKVVQKNNYPIVNYGFVKREDLRMIYASTEYLIYPSLAESFGLGIIEAIENGCKVIGADLPYMHAVCEPSIAFDPNSMSDIVQAFESALSPDVKMSTQKVNNEIEKLIALLN